jgi:hypothetical protein
MKNMALLVCLAFISMAFPEVTQAATRSSSGTLALPGESTPLISVIFSFVYLSLSTGGYNLAFFCGLPKNKPRPPHEIENITGSRKANIPTGLISSSGNSTSTKTPDDQD